MVAVCDQCWTGRLALRERIRDGLPVRFNALATRWRCGRGTREPQERVSSVAVGCRSDRDHQGFYTCGIGRATAQTILSYFSLERHMTLAEAVYRVAAAKFMCERTDGVGPKTILQVATRKNWSGYVIQSSEIEQLRAEWDASGAPRMTERAEDLVVQILQRHGPQHVTIGHMVRNVDRLTREVQSAEPKPKDHDSGG